MRYKVEPRDAPAEIAARRIGKTLDEFNVMKPRLLARGFPHPDPDTGFYDLVAIDRWCDARNKHLFGAAPMEALDASTVVSDRIASMRKVGPS